MVEEYEEIADPAERPDDQDDDLGKNSEHHIFNTVGHFLSMQDTLTYSVQFVSLVRII